MRTAGGNRDLTFLLAAAAVMVAVTIVTSLVQPLETTGDVGSSYAAGPDGAKAPYLLLQRLGYHVDRSFEPLTAIRDDPDSAVWILVSPTEEPSEGDRAALRRFVAAGGSVVAAGTGSARFLPDVSWKEPLFRADDDDVERSTYRPVGVSALARNAPSLEMIPPPSDPVLGPIYVPVYSNAQRVGVASAHLGAGRIAWIAGDDVFTNRSIGRADHVQLLLNMVGPLGKRRLLWDEHYHGHMRSFWSYLAQTPIPAGLVQAGILMLAAVLTFSVKRLPGRSVPDTSRLAPLEFVDAMGSLYRNARAHAAAVSSARGRLRRLLLERTGLPHTVHDARLAEMTERRLGIAANSIRAALEDSDPAGRGEWSEGEALSLVSRLQDLARRTSAPAGR